MLPTTNKFRDGCHCPMNVDSQRPVWVLCFIDCERLLLFSPVDFVVDFKCALVITFNEFDMPVANMCCPSLEKKAEDIDRTKFCL